MSIELHIGRLGKQSVSEIADKASHAIAQAPRARAVCLSPEGVATIETVAQAIEEDLVGVYTAAPGKFQLWRIIQGDLRTAIDQRGLKPKPRARTRVYAGRKVKEAA